MAGRWLMRDAAYYNFITSTSNTDAIPISGGTAVKFTNSGMTTLTGVSGQDDSWGNIPFSSDLDYYFFGTNHGRVNGATANNGINWNTNNVLMFGSQNGTINWNANTGRGVLLGNLDRRTNTFSYSNVENSTSPTGYKIIRMSLFYQNFYNDGIANGAEMQMRLIRGTSSTSNQAIEVRINKAASTAGTYNITNGTTFQNTFGATIPSTLNTSFVLQSNPTGNNWLFYNNSYVNIT